ncbi:MAG: SDR family NAD(P)-dependent oxidoreductase [Actinomycetota bacterium]
MARLSNRISGLFVEEMELVGLDLRCALVTGAAGDIGGAVALGLADEGCTLVLADHPSTGDRLAELRRQCRRSTKAATVEFDVVDHAAVTAALAMVDQIPSLLFNNAGVQGDFLPVQLQDPDDARRVIEVNVLGAMNVLTAVARGMIAAGLEGAIVNTASMAGVSGAPNMPAYSASKAAVIGLTMAAAKDLAPQGIRVNAVSPAFIGPGRMWTRQVDAQAGARSQYYVGSSDDVAQQMIAQIPLRRYGSTAEVAACVNFLLSEESSYLTGVNLEISGGAR